MTLYKQKFRAETTRLKDRDYGKPGKYFVTICTKKKMQWFGEIIKGKMQLSDMGKVAQRCLNEIHDHFPDVKTDATVVMPDHIHIIINITKPPSVETQNFASLQNRFGPQSRNLASIIRGFKIGVKKFATTNYPGFQWQPRFHDRVIRSDGELSAIRKYIHSNPSSWDKETIPWHADASAFNL